MASCSGLVTDIWKGQTRSGAPAQVTRSSPRYCTGASPAPTSGRANSSAPASDADLSTSTTGCSSPTGHIFRLEAASPSPWTAAIISPRPASSASTDCTAATGPERVKARSPKFAGSRKPVFTGPHEPSSPCFQEQCKQTFAPHRSPSWGAGVPISAKGTASSTRHSPSAMSPAQRAPAAFHALSSPFASNSAPALFITNWK